jgi:pimeloyl-ACP methyl ester carboxylesterase
MNHVILLHGFCENKALWSDVIEGFNEPNLHLIPFDLPGFGSNNNRSESIPDIAQCVFAHMDDNQIETATIIGHSMGGYVALEMAHKHPERIDAIGLVHSHGSSDSEDKKINRIKLIDFVNKKGARPFLKEFAKNLLSNKEVDKELMQQAYDLVKDTKLQGIVDAAHAMIGRQDHQSTIKNFDRPMLWIIGKQDTFMPYDVVIKQAETSQFGHLTVLENVGHLCMLEAPRKTSEVLRDFLNTVYPLTE